MSLFFKTNSESRSKESSVVGLDESMLLFQNQGLKLEKRRQQLLLKSDLVEKYVKQLKWITIFFLVFSTYIILNDSIGFSSAPFYVLHSFCTWQVKSQDCSYVHKLANALYGLEMTAGFLLSLQAASIYIVIDNPRSLKVESAV